MPSGKAEVVEEAVVSASMVTGSPLCAACAAALAVLLDELGVPAAVVPAAVVFAVAVGVAPSALVEVPVTASETMRATAATARVERLREQRRRVDRRKGVRMIGTFRKVERSPRAAATRDASRDGELAARAFRCHFVAD